MIVVGAGPAGLAVAATLRQLGHQPTVLEQSQDVGSSWRGRWDGLRLHTMRSLSALPDAPVPRRYGRWVARDDYADYLRGYAERFEIVPEFGVTVSRIDRDGDGWLVHTEGPGTRADARRSPVVVLATGYSRIPVVPDWPGRHRYTGSLIHSSQYRNASGYAGRRVLVVGAGNSGSEIAAELVEAGATVQLSVRTPPNIIRRSTLGVPSQLIAVVTRRVPERVMNTLVGVLRRVSVVDLREQGLPAPVDGFSLFLRTRTVPVIDHGFVEHVRAGRIGVVAAVASLSQSSVHLVDGTSVAPDSVICATGFRTGLEPLVGHLGVLDDSGVPRVHGAGTLPQAPGLYFVGITLELSGLLREIGREAQAAARALAAEALTG
jgi:putative flavoprotein involved in K+ transport